MCQQLPKEPERQFLLTLPQSNLLPLSLNNLVHTLLADTEDVGKFIERFPITVSFSNLSVALLKQWRLSRHRRGGNL